MRVVVYMLYTAFFISTNTLIAASEQFSEKELSTLSLNNLMSLDAQTTSVMKRAVSAKETPGSIYLLSAKKIKLAGATSLIDALTLLPGVSVRNTSNTWPIVSIRSAPVSIINNLLLMVDGRFIYNIGFPGIAWNHLDIDIDNIERIELIRGSSGTLWSSQAANGVINIITKHSLDTQKQSITFAAGSKYRHYTNARVAGQFLQSGSYRLNIKHHNIGKSSTLEAALSDAQQLSSLDFRLDYSVDDDLSFIISASHLNAATNKTYSLTTPPTYTNQIISNQSADTNTELMLRIDSRLTDSRSQQIQISYFDSSSESDVISAQMQRFNLTYAMNLEWHNRKLDWGIEYQNNSTNLKQNNYIKSLISNDYSIHSYGAFIQSVWQFNQGRRKIIGALRVDKSSADLQNQPSLKFLHLLTSDEVIWMNISQSAMQQTYAEKHIIVAQQSGVENPFIPGTYVPGYTIGNPEIETIKMANIELGYRNKIGASNIDLSIFHSQSNNYYGTRVDVIGTPPTQLNFVPVNASKLTLTGFDLVLSSAPSENWELQFEASYLRQASSLNIKKDSFIAYPGGTVKQYAIRSDYQLSPQINSYLKLRYKNRLKGENNSTVPSYYTLDAGFSWQANKQLNIGLYGHNLLHSNQQEYFSYSQLFYQSSKIDRDWLLKAEYKF